MRIFITLFLCGYLFLVPIQALAALCETKTPTRSLYNQNLEVFLQEQNTKFFSALSSAQSQTKDCSRSEQLRQIWDDLQRSSSFGIEQFISSFSSFYDNSCRQKDTEKLVRQMDLFEQGILMIIQSCKDPSQLISVSQESNTMLRLIRSKEGSVDEIKKYWDEELYKSNSNVCPTATWKDVERAWCELKNNAAQVAFLGENTKIDPGEERKRKEQAKQERIRIAQAEALRYIQQNLPSFLQLKSLEGASTQVGTFNGVLGFIFAPVINSINNFLDTNERMSLQETQVFPAMQTQDSIKLLTVQKLLEDINASYGKSYETQLYLEREIHAIRESVENMTKTSGSTRSFYSFVTLLRKNENMTPRTCSIDIDNP